MTSIPKLPYAYRWRWEIAGIEIAKIEAIAWIEARKGPAAGWSVSHIELVGHGWTRGADGDAAWGSASAVLPTTDPNHNRMWLELLNSRRHVEAIDGKWQRHVEAHAAPATAAA